MLDIFNRTCRVCGCWEMKACAQGCYWVDADLCSACVMPAQDSTPSPLPVPPAALGSAQPTAEDRVAIQQYFDNFNEVFTRADPAAQMNYRHEQRDRSRGGKL